MGLSQFLKNLFGKEEETENTAVESVASAPATSTVSLPMDEEEKNLVALVASCIAGKDQPDAQLHINKITRIQ